MSEENEKPKKVTNAELAKQLEAVLARQEELKAINAKLKEQIKAPASGGETFFRDHNKAMKTDADSKVEKVAKFFEQEFRRQNSGKYVYSIEYRVNAFSGDEDSSDRERKWRKADFSSNTLIKKGGSSDQEYATVIGALWYGRHAAFKGKALFDGSHEQDLNQYGQPDYRNAQYKGENKHVLPQMKTVTKSAEELAQVRDTFQEHDDYGLGYERESRSIEVK